MKKAKITIIVEYPEIDFDGMKNTPISVAEMIVNQLDDNTIFLQEHVTIVDYSGHLEGREQITCDDCRKCGETICGNDTENMTCFEPFKE